MGRSWLVTNTFEATTGVPEDRTVNTFCFDTEDGLTPSDAEIDALFVDIIDFYNGANTTGTLASYMSADISRIGNSATLRAYDISLFLDGSPHGSPYRSGLWTLGAAGGGAGLPAEVAAVLTTRGFGWASAAVEAPDGADPGGAVDRPRQRVSGRLFIGPLNAAAAGVVSSAVRLTAAFTDDILDAAERMYDAAVVDNFGWSVWSRVGSQTADITDFQVDNAFDTMRKRGQDATIRSTRNVA